jgi:hypothetical protein
MAFKEMRTVNKPLSIIAKGPFQGAKAFASSEH